MPNRCHPISCHLDSHCMVGFWRDCKTVTSFSVWRRDETDKDRTRLKISQPIAGFNLEAKFFSRGNIRKNQVKFSDNPNHSIRQALSPISLAVRLVKECLPKSWNEIAFFGRPTCLFERLSCVHLCGPEIHWSKMEQTFKSCNCNESNPGDTAN